MTRRRLIVFTCAVAVALAGVSTAAAQGMPDPRQMSGIPLPVSNLAAGTVTVRVVRGTLANPVPSQTVEIAGSGTPRRATTNEQGRAEFTGLEPGSRVRAIATVGGERLESREFAVPASGGIRLMLVASDPAGQTTGAAGAGAPDAAAAARPGAVVLGDESRFVFEMGDDGLSIFYILQVHNAASTPVQPDGPIVFELPETARGAALLEGSSPQAAVAGRRLEIKGPFAPGTTAVRLGYTLPIPGPELSFAQRLPIPLMHVAVVAQKVGDMQLASPQIAEQRTMPAQGNMYIAGRGGPVGAGGLLQFTFSGMPHHPTWPRNLALLLAVLILGGGAWSAVRAGSARDVHDLQRRELEAARDRLFDELTALETRQQGHDIDPDRYAERRRELIAALEDVYAALDDGAAVERAS